MAAADFFEYTLRRQLTIPLHPDCWDLLHYLFNENYQCVGALADANIREGIRCLRQGYKWHRIEICEAGAEEMGRIEFRVTEDSFLRMIFHQSKPPKFFCFKFGEHDRDFLFRVRAWKLIRDCDVIFGLFKKGSHVLEVVIYRLS